MPPAARTRVPLSSAPPPSPPAAAGTSGRRGGRGHTHPPPRGRCPRRSSPASLGAAGGRPLCLKGGPPPSSARPRRARGGKAGWGRGGAGRAAASGAVPGGSPWRPGLAGCGCPSYSRRGTWIKGSSGTWQGQTTSSSSAPTGTGCSSPASTATVSSGGRGAESPPPAAAASPLHGSGGAGSTQLARLGSAPLRGPHTRSGRNARCRGSEGRPDGFAATRRGLARTRSLPFSRQSQGGRGRGAARAAAFKPERGRLAAAAAGPRRSLLPAPVTGGGGRPPPPRHLRGARAGSLRRARAWRRPLTRTARAQSAPGGRRGGAVAGTPTARG